MSVVFWEIISEINAGPPDWSPSLVPEWTRRLGVEFGVDVASPDWQAIDTQATVISTLRAPEAAGFRDADLEEKYEALAPAAMLTAHWDLATNSSRRQCIIGWLLLVWAARCAGLVFPAGSDLAPTEANRTVGYYHEAFRLLREQTADERNTGWEIVLLRPTCLRPPVDNGLRPHRHLVAVSMAMYVRRERHERELNPPTL